MVCYNPIKAWRGAVNEKGKMPLVFSPPRPHGATTLEAQEVPCGKCIGCRLEYSRQWAVRCMHENQMHEDSCFITLTYDDDHLPPLGSLNVEDFQNFMKRFRKNHSDLKVRFFQCGEYGDSFMRPHHHALIYGYDFGGEDNVLGIKSDVKVSKELGDLWPFGFNTVGKVTFESSCYVARYVTKKVAGRAKESHYGSRRPEYITMSRRPGIGRAWYDKYSDEVYPVDSVVMKGKEMKPPRYYDKVLDSQNPQLYNLIVKRRIEKGRKRLPDLEGLRPLDLDSAVGYHFQRLDTQEFVQNKRQKDFAKRSLEKCLI